MLKKKIALAIIGGLMGAGVLVGGTHAVTVNADQINYQQAIEQAKEELKEAVEEKEDRIQELENKLNEANAKIEEQQQQISQQPQTTQEQTKQEETVQQKESQQTATKGYVDNKAKEVESKITYENVEKTRPKNTEEPAKGSAAPKNDEKNIVYGLNYDEDKEK